MEYDIVHAHELDELKERVSEKLKDGWRLIGGVSISTHQRITGSDMNTYVQAMVKG